MLDVIREYNMPKVSVIMPAYNAEQFIVDAINSILNQTFRDFELIIIDDCSSDKTVQKIKSFNDKRIRFFKNDSNQGVANTLNKGIEEAQGEYIARMDSDDISLPLRLEKQVQFLEMHLDIAIIGSDIEIFGYEHGFRHFSNSPEQFKVDLIFNTCYAHPSVMMRRQVLMDNNFRYNPEYSKMEDYDLWVRLSQKYKLSSISEVLLKYRVHSGQVTQKKTVEGKKQDINIKQRIISKLGITVDNHSVSLFVDCCGGKHKTDKECFDKVVSLCHSMVVNNSALSIYDDKLLKNSITVFLVEYLNKFPLIESYKLSKNTFINPYAYVIKRVIINSKIKLNNKRTIHKNRKKLNNKNFTIISNNCWGGMVYQKYGLQYLSPTIGLFFLGKDFVKLAGDWKSYINKQLKFIKWEDSKYFGELKESEPFPIALLGDIEVYFMHYRSKEEAQEKWNRRLKRINPEHMLFKLSQREGCDTDDIKEFLSIPNINKLCFSYENIPGAVYVPELKGLTGNENPLLEAAFDESTILRDL